MRWVGLFEGEDGSATLNSGTSIWSDSNLTSWSGPDWR